MTESYIPAPYITKIINDGIRQKKRKIAKPKFFPDQCVHHALIQIVKPYFMRGMYYYCCGSVEDRGDKRIVRATRLWIKNKPGKSKYVLKMDVRHFYETLNHEKLMACIEKKIKDPKVLRLCRLIIESYAIGAPIGNFTSPWFSNLSMEDVDHKIKEFTGRDCLYTRYVDDMVIIGPNKRKLHKTRAMIAELLSEKGLEMKSNWQVFRLEDRPLDFVGYKFYADGHVEIRKTILKRIKRKARKIEKMGDAVDGRNAAGMMAYMGRIHHSDSEYLFKTQIEPRIGGTKKLRRIISHERKLQRKTGRSLDRNIQRHSGK